MSMLRAGRLSFLRFTIVAVMLAFFLSILAASARAQSSYDANGVGFPPKHQRVS